MAYRYQALGPLQAGEGSRAFLGLAISEDNKARPVVIIWVPEAALTDSTLMSKIQRETEHAAKLDHPHIVTVMGFASLDEGNARVVEFADGESLRNIIEVGKKLPVRIAAKIICDACTGVHYAHIAGNDDGIPLVHGDLRPETMLVSFSGVTKITGYGALAFAPREIGGQRVKGRRVHSAPEQVIGGREAISIPTDVYLLGLTLYECLTGIVPYADQADFFDHAVLTLPLPPAPPGDVPAELEKVLIKACAKKAIDRYPNPLAMREAVEGAVGREIASTEELAHYLEGLFPESHDLRSARRHTIDAGIADFVRRQWSAGDKAPPTLPMMPAVVVPMPSLGVGGVGAPVGVGPQRVAAAPTKKPVVVSFPAPDEDDEKGDSNAPWLIFAALLVAAFGVWYAIQKSNQPLGVSEQADGPKPLGVAIAPRPPPVIAAPAVIDAGAPVAVAAVDSAVDAGALVPVPSTDVEVEIDSNPAADVVVEGATLGRTPWKGTLPAGRRVISLVNKEAGLNAGRVVQLKTGEPYSGKYTFEKGTVSVAAPEGAVVYIDGVRKGVAPLKGDLEVYEGAHRILVMVGQSKWSEPFNLFARQKVNFNVELE